MQFEYTRVYTGDDISIVIRLLNELGKDRWEVVATLGDNIILKRERYVTDPRFPCDGD